ncbi:Patatin-like serine hydrolase [Diaporthe eres]|nr:Patatin-like serine hydrolase [Diaporthe eres]
MCELATRDLKDAVRLTASSLAQYCWPGEFQPYFPPEEVFKQCFEGPLRSLQRSLAISDFCDQVQSTFCRMVQSGEAARHVEYVKLSGLDWTALGSIRSNGRLEYGSCYLVSCPLCGGPDTVHLKPRTAPVRALVLLGGKDGATGNFLRRLTSSLYGRLTDYFDIVIGSGNAMAVTVDIFAEGRSLDSRRAGSKWLAWRSKAPTRISPLPKTRCRVAVLGKRGILSNYRGALADHSSPLEFLAQEVERLWFGSRIMTIIHDGSSTSDQTPQYRQSIALTSMSDPRAPNMSDLLVASLFFLEVVDEPGYLFPQECQIRMRCRLPAGHHLFNLIYKLRYRDARVYCRSNSRRWHEHILCDTRQWEKLKEGAEYSLSWAMEFTSLDMQLHVEMDGLAERNYISDGPVTLKDLSQDPGRGTSAPVGRVRSEESCRALGGRKIGNTSV